MCESLACVGRLGQSDGTNARKLASVGAQSASVRFEDVLHDRLCEGETNDLKQRGLCLKLDGFAAQVLRNLRLLAAVPLSCLAHAADMRCHHAEVIDKGRHLRVASVIIR